jgi:hypothetical protein
VKVVVGLENKKLGGSLAIVVIWGPKYFDKQKENFERLVLV